MRILLVIPVCIEEIRHVEMLRVQSLLRDRLLKAVGNSITIISAAICDFVFDPYRAEAEQLKDRFDIWVDPEKTAAHAGPSSIAGIRRPTNYAIDKLARDFSPSGDFYILRVIQDNFVYDPHGLMRDILATVDRQIQGNCLVGSVEWGTCDWHASICESMGLPYVTRFRYLQGALIFAAFPVWEHFYLGLPPQVTHYLDDVMMSLWLTKEGGVLLSVNHSTFRHMHHCEPEFAQQVYHAQRSILYGEASTLNELE